MHDAAADRDDLPPWHFWMRVDQLVRQASGCLADDLDHVDENDLDVLVLVEGLPALGHAGGDLVRCLDDVCKPLGVTSHRATPSRRTRSRILSFRPLALPPSPNTPRLPSTA